MTPVRSAHAPAGPRTAVPGALLVATAVALLGAAPADAARAPIGDLPGWRQILVEDFDTPAPVGRFPGTAYRARWQVYPDGGWDTTRRARQAPSRVLSVRGGSLRWRFHDNAEGVPQIATALPRLTGRSAYEGIRYGRFAVRFRSTDVAPGYSMVFLLWPDGDRWPHHGEVNFPAGELTRTQGIGYTFIPAQPTVRRISSSSRKRVTSWHTAVTEWTPGRVRYILDGRVIGVSRYRVPTTKMHWVLQTDTTEHGRPPAPGTTGNLQVDWVAAWAHRPGTR